MNKVFDKWHDQCAAFCLWMALPSLLLAAVLAQPWKPFGVLARDPLTVASRAEECCRYYFGFLSNLGVMFWIFAGGAALTAGAAFWRLSKQTTSSKGTLKQNAMYFFTAGALSLLLAADDLFMIHEEAALYSDIGEQLLLGLYAVLVALYAVRFRNHILRQSPLFFLLAIMLLASSAGIDAVVDISGGQSRLRVEESLKFLGIAGWAAYHVRSAYLSLSAPSISQSEK